MRRSVWPFAGFTIALTLSAACSKAAREMEPEPAASEAELGEEVNFEGFPDSLGLLINEVEQEAVGAEAGEVEAEVREMFDASGAELEELPRAETPSWDIPITINDAVERWLEFFQTDGRENFTIYLQRAGRYEPMMRAMFRDAGLPEDLVYMSLIESGFSPRAYSRARAVGLWQFISSTGRLYGLRVSYWVDERRDPILATRAAVAHLRDLYEEFGSWYLAAAAYNGGVNRVRRSIRRSGSDDFWMLSQRRYLRRETRNYVPKLIAAALIAKQPDHYGFLDIERHPPLAYELVRVPGATSIDVIAKAAGVSVEEIRELNPQLLRGVTPPGGSYDVRVPPGSGHRFALAYASVPPGERVTWVVHVVRSGNTLGQLARDYRVSVSAIRAANGNVNPRRLRIGQRLVIPRAGRIPTYTRTAPRTRRSAPARVEPQAGSGPYITYTVQGGDSLWAIAKRYEVTPRDLMRWNGLTSSRIYPGDQVRIYVGSE
ncbi:MAG: LysM peptidoglycan-binding domain-containing protein [Gemmatimonadetes bacterium]|uniref:LysM peptidoglycan-binding domain-containing protein n=1 Tax=Candidatus Kutchimonas denitrificans TaxID=3056748 RepID=A0AAE5CCE5_9BACT|nr:LysM peptidoglycan-binding domain-containing protein [Gemmatimonadota bacterium]NIR75555.1 LysM peptidoglycan-binding domain-containing protein [Candidatus Kutchimonas denitrificans]NIS01869.1 LysM peptidoglycan-binding domain-containing protein [Gemmatimonadota bacterium]NIT67650.1 LysM peptidoglycan-binding domain-containing protein [Gemmatimonadota bacterium]NIU53524.1 LysM peptidoglycan-binding domain-containing protein [Gemmatimonadota bacterium]